MDRIKLASLLSYMVGFEKGQVLLSEAIPDGYVEFPIKDDGILLVDVSSICMIETGLKAFDHEFVDTFEFIYVDGVNKLVHQFLEDNDYYLIPLDENKQNWVILPNR